MQIYVVMSVDRDGIGPIHGAFTSRAKADLALARLSESHAVNGNNIRMAVLDPDVVLVPTINDPWVEKIPI